MSSLPFGSQDRTTVFVSYSHVDQEHFKQFMDQIRPLERQGIVECWTDTRSPKGGLWREDLEAAIRKAKVAVLLVSKDYLASDFIQTWELPKLLQAARSYGLTVLPVILTHCRWDVTDLERFQIVNSPERPLAVLTPSEQDAEWVNVTKEIEKALGLPALEWGHGGRSPGSLWRYLKKAWRPGLAGLIGVGGLIGGLVWRDAQKPRVDTIRPITPVTEGQLEIMGANFSGDRERVEVLFDNIRAPLLDAPISSRLLVRVPPEATTGPLRVVNKVPFLPLFLDPEAVISIPTVNQLKEDVSLLSETVKTSDDKFTVQFSALNLSTDRRVTVYDLRLEMIVLVDLQEPSFRRRRIDLGSFEVSSSSDVDMRQLNYPVTTLLPEGIVVELRPQESESFDFTIFRPKSAHKLHMMFAISASYYDDRGRRSRSLSDRIFNVQVDDLEGFAWLTDLPLDSATLDQLAKKYQESFHGIAGLHDRESSP